MLVILTSIPGSAQTIVREYQLKKAGTSIGSTKVELNFKDGETHLHTSVDYPQMGVVIQTSYVFTGTEFPKQPSSYSFSIVAGGMLDLEMNWAANKASYKIKQLLGKSVEVPVNVLPLDNNVISDYMVATWVYDKSQLEDLTYNLIVPVLLPQGSQMIHMVISYIGEEQIGQYHTEHYRINIGVEVDLWVDQTDRCLVKLHIPMQAFEITAIDLQQEPEAARVFDDFGGYSFSETQFQISVDRATLSGTITIPKVDRQMPGVILVAGSGPTDRDGNSYVMPGPADYLKEIAHYLASRGIVVLRYDKRGVGESPGEVQSFRDFIDDISSLTDYLANLPFVEKQHLFLIGHSEGAWLVSEAARNRSDLAGIVLLAGSGYPFFDTLKRQLLEQTTAAIAAGMYEAGLLERTSKALDDMFTAVVHNTSYDIAQFNLPSEIEQLILTFIYQKDLYRDWLTANPAQVLADVNVPVLIMQGTADTQIQVSDAEALAAALPETQRELYIFDGLDHVLKMTFGTPLPYTDPSRRVDTHLLQILGDWIITHSY